MKKYKLFILAGLTTTILSINNVFAHPGNTDSKGGHHVRTEGYGVPLGTYHFHDKNGNIIPVNKETSMPLEISVIIDGVKVEFQHQPIIIDGNTLVSIHNIIEKTDYIMHWDKQTNNVYINSPEVEQQNIYNTTGEINVFVNNEKIIFQDQQPTVLNDNLFVHIRSVMEKLNYEIEWNETLRLINLSKIS